MKNLLTTLLALSSLTTFGAPLAYDDFDYPLSSPAPILTNLVGQVCPTGQHWDWAAALNATSTNNQPSIFPGSLTTPGLAPSAGNSLKLGGKGGSARLGLGTSISSGSVYYSCIVKITDMGSLGTGAGGIFFAAFTGGGFVGTQEPNVICAGLLVKKVDTDKFCLGIKKASGGAIFKWPSTDEVTNSIGDTIFVVASYNFVPGSTVDDEARLWISPDPATFGAATAPAAPIVSGNIADFSGSSIDGFTVFNRAAVFEPGALVVDELKIGTTWADVTRTSGELAILSQPQPTAQRIIEGGQATLKALTYRATTYHWQHNGTDIPGATQRSLTINNARLADAGSYRLVAGKGLTTVTSDDAVITVSPDIYPRLVPLWSIAPLSRPYMSVDAGTLPNQRYIAYNALSNQVLIVSRTNITVNYPTNAAIYVVDANTGADLYQMNTDTSTIYGGLDITGGETNFLTLNGIDVAADGAVYAANVANIYYWPNWFSVYRWESSASSAAPGLIWGGDPANLTLRWGDSLAVRGSGLGTQILVDDSTGTCGALLTPQDPITITWTSSYFANAAGGQTGGRALLFSGTDNTFWEKHAGSGLNLVSYDLAGNTSSLLATHSSLPGGPNLVAFDPTTNILCAINLGSSSGTPDTLDQYDISDPSLPAYLASYKFPVNHNANNNAYGRVIFAGDKVLALDANNGLAAFRMVPVLHTALSGGNLVLSWAASTPGYTLRSTPSLARPITWTGVSTGTLVGDQYFVTNSVSGPSLFYCLEK